MSHIAMLLQVQAMYNWPNVAERTAAVYNKVLSTASNHDELLPRLRRYRSIGIWAGLVFCCIVVLLHWFWRFLEWQQPAAEVERAVDWPSIQEMLAKKPQQQQQQHLHHQERQQNSKPEPDLQQHAQQLQQPATPVERGVDRPSERRQMLEDKQQQRGEQRGEQDDIQGSGQQHTQHWQQIEQEQARQQQQQEEQGIMSKHRQRQRVNRNSGQPLDQEQRQQQEQERAAPVNAMVDGQKTAGRYNLRSRTKK